MCVCYDKETNKRKKYLHNNQLILILCASGFALDLDSIMEGQGNTTIMVGIIEEV